VHINYNACRYVIRLPAHSMYPTGCRPVTGPLLRTAGTALEYARALRVPHHARG